jgi:BirA family transcriptional regulator, biotin operon repressor / biotin---[acetyl-CoA-carboxylase] ligase
MSGSKSGRAAGQQTTLPAQGPAAAPARLTSDALFDAPLSGEALARALNRGATVEVEVVEQTGSTNDDLLERSRLRVPDLPILRAALHQMAGRGRHGRRWHDARGRALLFSVMKRWSRDPAAAPAVTLACGVAVAEALRTRGVDAKLKWPNDILLGGRKLGGILTELAFDSDGRAGLVVGIGLNLCLGPEQRVAIDQPAAALDERVPESELGAGREAWIALAANAILEAIERFEQQGFAPFRAGFDALFAYAGRPAVVSQSGQPVLSGIATGVDPEGRLLLSTDGGIQVVASGELSLRGAEA